uniref:Secreted protein n=1 Tax=Lepeophtheirus salmonis TaxID=72036 RepID=A0A0K2U1Y7_LEPSM
MLIVGFFFFLTCPNYSPLASLLIMDSLYAFCYNDNFSIAVYSVLTELQYSVEVGSKWCRVKGVTIVETICGQSTQQQTRIIFVRIEIFTKMINKLF